MNNHCKQMSEQAILSYQPMPFYKDCSHQLLGKNYSVKHKLDLNRYCIKRPTQTCFIQATNPHWLAWGIEQGDILVVEQDEQLEIGDLLVLERNEQFLLYEILANKEGKWLLMSLDAKHSSISISHWQELAVVGRITNIIHQFRERKRS